MNVRLTGNETEMDYGVEADMMANADETGAAIIEAPAPVRRRAALERGLQPFLHVRNLTKLISREFSYMFFASMKSVDPMELVHREVETRPFVQT